MIATHTFPSLQGTFGKTRKASPATKFCQRAFSPFLLQRQIEK